NIISLAATLEKSGFTNVKINQQSIGTASFENKKFKMERITHYPSIEVPSSQTEKLKSILDKLLVIADKNCMISNAIRNNVIISIEPNLI
ncbi:peroxiredoxin, partial [Staphylococcus hominis]